MSAFDACRAIEAEGLAVLRPYLDEQADGRHVVERVIRAGDEQCAVTLREIAA